MLKHLFSSKKVLVLIIILSFVLRVFDIEDNPKSMYGDELTLVYDAYSILKTGYDQKGNFLPLFFEMGGGRPAGYIYATIPFVALFGPSATAARALSILSSMGIVILIYLLSSTLISKKVGLLSAFIASLTPWELNLSRGGFESHFALFLSLLGFYFFYLSLKSPKLLMLSGIFFALSMQTYLTYVFTIPFFVVLLIYLNKDKLLKPSSYISLSLTILILVLSLTFSLYNSSSQGSKDRFSNLFILNQPSFSSSMSEKISRERLFSPLDPVLATKIHNKYLEFISSFSGNYLKNFSPDFLITEGDKNPRHNPSAMGQFFWVNMALFVLGFVYISLKHKNLLPLLIGWVLIAPVPGALTGTPHAIRNSFLLPPLIIISAAGVYYLLTLKSNLSKSFSFFLLILFLVELPIFLYRFYMLAPSLNSGFWSYSAKRAALDSFTNKDEYKYIIISTSIPDVEFAYPVYNKIDPQEVLYSANHKTYFGEYGFLKYGNVYLGSLPNSRVKTIMDSLEGSVLYIGTMADRGMVDNEKIIRDIDNTPLYVTSTKE